ncbi:hypothetical protein PIB30_054339, partial [Stylosanthes scabra]|nr:hypothetical protein [Stylosanthes scabra]
MMKLLDSCPIIQSLDIEVSGRSVVGLEYLAHLPLVPRGHPASPQMVECRTFSSGTRANQCRSYAPRHSCNGEVSWPTHASFDLPPATTNASPIPNGI